jgi:hypothetical protein
MLSRAPLTAINTAAQAASAISVRAGKAAVNADFLYSFSVFFSEVSA